MEKKNTTSQFPLEEFDRIEDIIYLDEPILTHVKRKEKDYFLYLVDTQLEKELDVYLLFEITEDLIYEYLTSKISLRSLILKNENFIYVVSQDFNGIVKEYSVASPKGINEEYLPLEDSFLNYEPTEDSRYYSLIHLNSYVKKLRQNAFYIKFQSENSKYAETIGLNELSNDLLQNISKSFKGFLKADFRTSLGEYQTDEKKLNAIYRQLEDDLDLRMVSLKYASFEIGLANDKVMKSSIKDKRIRTWAEEVGYKYKEVVLSSDFNENRVNNILASYSEEERNKIFRPLFKITENPNFSIQVKDSKDDMYNKIIIKDKAVIDRILPTPNDDEDKDEDYEIIHVTSVVNKNRKSKSISLEGNLFSATDNTLYDLTPEDFKKYGYPIEGNIHLPLQIKVQKNHLSISAEYDGQTFAVAEHSMKINEGIKNMAAKISKYYLGRNQ